MQIYGLQKVTLLDFPGMVACTVFLGGCNFRCPFCHNMELAKRQASPVVSEDTFFEFLNERKDKLDGVAITGGEPCVSPELPEFIRKIRALGYAVKLDTNGTKPEMLRALLDEGLLDYVAMDIKNSFERYAETCGLAEVNLYAIELSIRHLMESGVDYEFRTTVVSEFHDEQSFKDIGRRIAGAKNYFLQQFVDRDTVPNHSLHAPTLAELEQYRDICREYVPATEVRGV